MTTVAVAVAPDRSVTVTVAVDEPAHLWECVGSALVKRLPSPTFDEYGARGPPPNPVAWVNMANGAAPPGYSSRSWPSGGIRYGRGSCGCSRPLPGRAAWPHDPSSVFAWVSGRGRSTRLGSRPRSTSKAGNQGKREPPARRSRPGRTEEAPHRSFPVRFLRTGCAGEGLRAARLHPHGSLSRTDGRERTWYPVWEDWMGRLRRTIHEPASKRPF